MSPEDPDRTEQPQEPSDDQGDSSGGNEAGAKADPAPSAAGSPEILIVDDDDNIRNLMAQSLSARNLAVRTAASGEEALKALTEATRLLVVDLKMPGMSGIETVAAMRQQGWEGKVIILTGHPERETILQARKLGISDYVTKPFDPNALWERIEETLEITRALHEVSASGELYDCILDPGRSVPVYLPGETELSLQLLEELSKNALEVLQQQGVVPARDYYVVNDVQKVGDLSGREPTLKHDHPLDEAGIKTLSRIWRDPYAGIVDEKGAEMGAIRVQKNPVLGEYLTLSTTLAPDAFVAKLNPSPLCAHVLKSSRRSDLEPALTALADAWRHHEVAFIMHQLKAAENRRLSGHLLATSFLATVHATQEMAQAGTKLDPEAKRVALAVMGVCAALHDLGLVTAAPEIRFGSPAYLRRWQKHPAIGYDLVKESSLYPEVKAVIRDHHKPLIERSCKYDAFTRIVQLASDLDNLVRGQGILSSHNGPQIRKHPAPLTNACREIIFRSRQGFYRDENVEDLLTGCKFSALVNYYKRLQEISERPCKVLILSPNAVNPVTALCERGPIRAKKHQQEIYCEGCSHENTHTYRGKLHHRCLRGHEEVTDLNQTIKHLLQQPEEPADRAAKAANDAAKAPESEGAPTGSVEREDAAAGDGAPAAESDAAEEGGAPGAESNDAEGGGGDRE